MATNPNCGVYQCTTSSIFIPSTQCGKVFESRFYYLQVCSATSELSYCNTTSFNCTAMPSISKSTAYPGENCATNSDCIYNSCANSVCVGIKMNQKCIIHEQCDPGLRCFAGSCIAQLLIGQSGCRDYQDCVNHAGCNLTYSSQNGVCFEYASVGTNSIVTDCRSSLSEMCKSGYCSQFGSWYSSLGLCKEAPMSLKTLPTECAQDTDCLGYDGSNVVMSRCQCGYNNLGQSYCSPFIGDPAGVSVISTWVNILKNSTSCNTSRRTAQMCLQKSSQYDKLQSVIFGYENYAQTLNNDLCIKTIYTSAYWNYSLEIKLISFLSLLIFS